MIFSVAIASCVLYFVCLIDRFSLIFRNIVDRFQPSWSTCTRTFIRFCSSKSIALMCTILDCCELSLQLCKLISTDLSQLDVHDKRFDFLQVLRQDRVFNQRILAAS